MARRQSTSVLVLLLLFAMSLLAACGAAQTPAAPAAPAEPAPPAAEVAPESISGTLTIWGWEAPMQALQLLDAEFRAEYPNITLQYELKAPADLYQQVQLAAAAGAGAPDIALIEDSHLSQLLPLGILADLTANASPYRNQINAYRWNYAELDGRIFAMPWDSGPTALFYRRDVFEQAGIDPESIQTWEDYYTVAGEIKAKTGVAMLPEAQARNNGRFFEMLLWQQGLGYINADGAVILDTDPRIQSTLEYMGRLWNDDLALDAEPWTDPWYASMADGTVATVPGAVWMGTFLKSWIAPDASGNWGVIPMPAWEAGGAQAANDGGSALVIFEESQQKDAAWAYLQFHLGRTESQLAIYKETDLFPSLESLYSDPFFQEPDPYFGGDQVRALFAEVVQNVPAAGVYSSDYQEMNALLTPEIQKFATGQQTAQEALSNAARAIRERTGRP
jgi:ABC-type glycerol-3-phosphate transport system substrate-binding protein